MIKSPLLQPLGTHKCRRVLQHLRVLEPEHLWPNFIQPEVWLDAFWFKHIQVLRQANARFGPTRLKQVTFLSLGTRNLPAGAFSVHKVHRTCSVSSCFHMHRQASSGKRSTCSPVCHNRILPLLWDRLSANAGANSTELDTHATAESAGKLEVVDGHCEGCAGGPGKAHAVSFACTVPTGAILVSILAVECSLWQQAAFVCIVTLFRLLLLTTKLLQCKTTLWTLCLIDSWAALGRSASRT